MTTTLPLYECPSGHLLRRQRPECEASTVNCEDCGHAMTTAEDEPATLTKDDAYALARSAVRVEGSDHDR